MLHQEKIPALLIGHGLPNYNQITPNEVTKHIPFLIKDLSQELSLLENSLKQKLDKEKALTWNEVMKPLHQIGEKLRWSWGVISHLNGVCNSSKLREAYALQQPEIVRFGNKIGQSKIIYKSLLNLKDRQLEQLNKTQLRIIDTELLSMRHRGVGLTGPEKAIFNERSERLAELSNAFSNNVLDAT